MNLQHILVVIEPDADSQPALDRAKQLAKLADCRLELLLADHTPYLDDGYYFDPTQAKQLRQEHGQARLQELETLAEPLRENGLEVSCTTAWGNPPIGEVIARISEANPSLVIKATRHHSKVSRLLLSNTDWELIRNCAAPLLMVKSGSWAATPVILTSVDPYHVHDKPAALDSSLIAAAQSLAKLSKGEVYLFHSDWVPPLAGAYALVHDEALDKKILADLAKDNGIDTTHCHWSSDEIVKALPAVVEKNSVDVVVMGSMSRSKIDQLLIGSTAERVLDNLECDVLLLRPDS